MSTYNSFFELASNPEALAAALAGMSTSNAMIYHSIVLDNQKIESEAFSLALLDLTTDNRIECTLQCYFSSIYDLYCIGLEKIKKGVNYLS